MLRKITILGSINMDLTTSCERAANPGETVLGTSFSKSVGGKGANLAAALAKQGEHPLILGVVGDDEYADELINGLKGVDTSCIDRAHTNSGLAQITIEKGGSNRIIVVPGANAKLDTNYVSHHVDAIKNASILLSQLEIPQSSILSGFKVALKAGVPTLLNYAPALRLDYPLLDFTNILVLNEHELEFLCKKSVNVDDFTFLQDFAKSLFAKHEGLKILILTLGEKGVFYADGARSLCVSAYPAKEVVDTTGAGDCFIASFILALLKEYKEVGKKVEGDILKGELGFTQLKNALYFATKAAAFSVARQGAQPSFPSLKDLD